MEQRRCCEYCGQPMLLIPLSAGRPMRGDAAYNDPNYALFNAARDATTAALWLAQAVAEQPELADALGLQLEALRGIEAAIEQEMEMTSDDGSDGSDGVPTRLTP